MSRVGRFQLCGECGHRAAGVLPRADGLDRLPAVIAIPLLAFATEPHPVLQLHRLCDAAELVTRFATLVALAELRAQRGDGHLPAGALAELQPRIERPTFGQWCGLIRALIAALDPGRPLVVPELPGFVAEHLAPGLDGDPARPDSSLVHLRNDVAHGGAVTLAAARIHLDRWGPWLDGITERLGFLADAELCAVSGGAARRLTGTGPALGPALDLPADLSAALARKGGHVVLLRAGRWLDLWPLCGYGPPGPGLRQEGPLVYARAERDRLLYAALGVDWPRGERADGVRDFRELFRLDERPTEAPVAADFESELRTDAAGLVGRAAELRQIKDAVKAADGGVLWVGGAAGIGKSYLLARVAIDLGNDPRRACRVAWRFRASDGERCSRGAFLRHAVGRLADWLGKPDVVPEADPDARLDQLAALLDEAAARPATDPRARPPRVVFVIDGLDEIDRTDHGFARLPFRLSRPNVIWVCGGRPERGLPLVFLPDRCTHVFPAGLPPMTDADIRGMLLDGTGNLKYDLLRLDQEAGAGVANAAVEAVVARAAGLPLYVHFVVQDVLAGHFRFDELGRKLPPGLHAYYDDLLRRLGIGDLQAVLTPLVVTLCWAFAPLDEATLHLLMVRRKVATDDAAGRELVRRALAAVRGMVRPAPADGGDGYELYHFSFREHVRADPHGVIGGQNALARDELCGLARDWSALPPGHPARGYALRYGPRTLHAAERWDELEAVLTDGPFLEAKAEAGLVFELAADLGGATGLPADRPLRRIIGLLAEAIRRDAHFIARHPETLFQCLWNTGWWYDCPDAEKHYTPPAAGWDAEAPPWCLPGPKLSSFLEAWRAKRARCGPVEPPPADPPVLGTESGWLDAFRESWWWAPVGLFLIFSHAAFVMAAGGVVGFAAGWFWGYTRMRSRFRSVVTGVVTGLASLSGLGVLALVAPIAPVWRKYAAVGLIIFVFYGPGQVGALLHFLRLTARFRRRIRRLGRRERAGGRRWVRALRPPPGRLGSSPTVLTGRGGDPSCAAAPPDGRWAVAIEGHTEVIVWDVRTGHSTPLSAGSEEGLSRPRFRWVTLDRDGRVWAVSDTGVRAWDAESGAAVAGYDFAPGLRAIRFVPHPEGPPSVILFDAEKATYSLERGGSLTASLSVAGFDASAVADVSADLRRILLRDWEHVGTESFVRFRLWDARRGVVIAEARVHDLAGVDEIWLSPEGDWVVVRPSSRKKLWVWGPLCGRPVPGWFVHPAGEGEPFQRPFLGQCLSPSGDRLAAGCPDGTIVVWELPHGDRPRVLRGHGGAVQWVQFATDQTVVSCSDDATVRVWDLSQALTDYLLAGDLAPILIADWLILSTVMGTLVMSEDTEWNQVSFDLLTGQGICQVSITPNTYSYMRLHVYQKTLFPDVAKKQPRGFAHGFPETHVERPTGEVVGFVPGEFGLFRPSSTELKSHPSGFYWMGFQANHLSLFQLECD